MLEAQYESEKTLVEKIREIRGQLEEAGSANGDVAELDRLRGDLQGLEQQLEAVQGETPLKRVCVDAQIIGEVISGWTGIPLGRMMKDEVESILSLEDSLRQRIIGQDDALRIIGQQVQTSRARLDDPRKPIGVFLLVGPSGVGKTETAVALAETLYGGERNLITINMSEFQRMIQLCDERFEIHRHRVTGLSGWSSSPMCPLRNRSYSSHTRNRSHQPALIRSSTAGYRLGDDRRVRYFFRYSYAQLISFIWSSLPAIPRSGCQTLDSHR